MTAFIKKYKWTIVYWITLLFIILYFTPRQNKFYLDNDIKYFKSHYIQPILIWMGVTISVGLFLYWLGKTKSIKQSGTSFVYLAIILTFFLFIFQDIFLGASLFINRIFKSESVEKTYKAVYMPGTDNSKINFIPYDLVTKQISTDSKLINKLNTLDLKQNDTIRLKLQKGIFGIIFNSQPFDDK